MNYLNEKIYGIPKQKRKGHNTGSGKRKKEYVHKINISGYEYYKVHIKRGQKSKIKYFKSFKEASMFVDLLKLNPYF